MSLRQNVIREAHAQRDLRRAGQPIPAEPRRYARIAGAILSVALRHRPEASSSCGPKRTANSCSGSCSRSRSPPAVWRNS